MKAHRQCHRGPCTAHYYGIGETACYKGLGYGGEHGNYYENYCFTVNI